MSDSVKSIPFSVDISKMIELLATQIYQSPFALLRENTQNSFDAILLRKAHDDNFEPAIEITIDNTKVKVVDNGIGMSLKDLHTHFWCAGSSSKNTDEARAAGVVGTFGIGAMANFGIAEELMVETESLETGERTWCAAKRSTLSVTENCIDFEVREPQGKPGTCVTAIMQEGNPVNVDQAKGYISEFVAFLPIRITVNNELVSQRPINEAVPTFRESWSFSDVGVPIGNSLKANVDLVGSAKGDIRISMTNIESNEKTLTGKIVIRQGLNSLRTFRSSYGLATVSVSSIYQFGGIVDLEFLKPTAGREALTTASMQILQRMISEIDDYVSLKIAERPESNENTQFISWAAQRNRFDLCKYLKVRFEPGDSLLTLEEVQHRSRNTSQLVYGGMDPAIIQHASEDRPLVILSRLNPRRSCEDGFLRKYCKIEDLTDNPKILELLPKASYSLGESALVFRISSILSADYFVKAEIVLGKISHGLPILIETKTQPIQICLDPNGQATRLTINVYEHEYSAFTHMTKDFVRNIIFPKITKLVPSATRQGAEAFLKSIQFQREVFEYEEADLENLKALWRDYLKGRLSMEQASQQTIARSYQVVDTAAKASVKDVVPGVIENQDRLHADTGTSNLEALPPILRLDIPTDKKLLTIPDNEHPLKNYRGFLAITDRVRRDKGDFFLQPHKTSVVWGGQKALFIFEHHSGDFGLYYDLHTRELISQKSGGGSFETCTIVMKNKIFIPIPEQILSSFVPATNERKRFEVRCDILHTERKGRDEIELGTITAE